ncbi:MAG: hypothetical protein M1438_09640 [Deltaproteobacteria bacterium]|nr:hypothetical protein [Deltaproteobacteria bacterium]
MEVNDPMKIIPANPEYVALLKTLLEMQQQWMKLIGYLINPSSPVFEYEEVKKRGNYNLTP